MGVVVLIACPLDYTLLKLQVSLENQQDASRIDATPSLDGYTYQDWCVWGPGFPRWLEVGKLLDPLKKWLGMVQVYGTKQFLSEALDFDKIVVCFSLFIISRFRALWPITYYAYCLITPQLYPYHTKPYHGRSFRVTLLDIYGAQLSWAELSSSWDWARCRRRRMGRRTMAARRGVDAALLQTEIQLGGTTKLWGWADCET